MTKLVTFGETMVSYNATYIGPFDPTVDGPYEVYCAGAESNVCLDLQLLDVPGLETVWVSKLGLDQEGDAILRSLNGRTTVVAPQVQEIRSGIAYVNHMQDGSVVKSYRRKGSAASTVTFDDVRPHLADADALHVTGITPALSSTTHDTIFHAIEYASERTAYRSHSTPTTARPSGTRPTRGPSSTRCSLIRRSSRSGTTRQRPFGAWDCPPTITPGDFNASTAAW